MSRHYESLLLIFKHLPTDWTNKEIDNVLEAIDIARLDEEPDDLAGVENLHSEAEESGKKIAQANLVMAIIACERFLLEIPDSELMGGRVEECKRRVDGYLGKLAELELDLAILSRFHFSEGEVSFDVMPGTVGTLIQIKHRAEGLPSDSLSDMVAVWIPTGKVKELKDKLGGEASDLPEPIALAKVLENNRLTSPLLKPLESCPDMRLPDVCGVCFWCKAADGVCRGG